MHELSLTRNIVELCLEHAVGRKVLSVTVQIGDLAGAEPDAMSFCFEVCCRGTLMEGARFIVERIPAIGTCTDCWAEFLCSHWAVPCPRCGSLAITCQGGDELRVKELEVE